MNAAAVNEWAEAQFAQFRKLSESNAMLQKATAATGAPAWILALSGVVVGLCTLLWFISFDFLSMALIYGFPLFASFRALEDKEPSAAENWLMFWVTYGSFLLLESLVYNTLLAWIPLYRILRLAFVIYLLANGAKGARHIYSTILAPGLRPHRKQIQAALDQFATEAVTHLSGVMSSVNSAREKVAATGPTKETMQEAADARKAEIQELVEKELLSGANPQKPAETKATES